MLTHRRSLLPAFLALCLAPAPSSVLHGYEFGEALGAAAQDHTVYYAPNNRSVEWNGNKATIVVFAFGHVRQGEVWLSKEGVDGKSVLECPHDGLLFATYLVHAMNKGAEMEKKGLHMVGRTTPVLVGKIPMGEHEAGFYGDAGKVTITFGPKDSTGRQSYTFNLKASYRLGELLAIMCKSLRGPHHGKHAHQIKKMLEAFKHRYEEPPKRHKDGGKKPAGESKP